MTAIAPNGVAVADYDPTGIGGVMFVGHDTVNRQQHDVGEIIVASEIGLREATVLFLPNGGGGPRVNGDVLPGSWKLLGWFHPTSPTVPQVATLAIRVS